MLDGGVRSPRPTASYKKASQATTWLALISGAEDRIRTGDLLLGKEALYQLSYFRVSMRTRQVRLLSGSGTFPVTAKIIPHRAGDFNCPREISFGAGNRTRTGDTQLGKLVLYQLSYSRVSRLG